MKIRFYSNFESDYNIFLIWKKQIELDFGVNFNFKFITINCNLHDYISVAFYVIIFAKGK